MTESRPIQSLNGLRGYLAIWVLIFHFIKVEGVGGVLHGPDFLWAGSVALDAFFVLSGFVMTYAYGARFSEGFDAHTYKEHLIMRFGRMYPMHAFTLALLVAAVLLATWVGHPLRHSANYDWNLLVPNALMVQAWFGDQALTWNYVSWSVSAEWFAYLFLVPLYLWLTARRSPVLWIALAVIAGIVFDLTVARDPTTGLHLKPSDNAILRVVVDFFAGVAVCRAWQGWKPRIREEGDLLTMLGVGALCLTASFMFEAGPLILPSIMLLIFGLARSGVWSGRLFANPVITHLGEISYSVYLIHPFVMMASNLLVRRYLDTATESTAYLILAAGVSLSVLIATFTYHVIEMPGRRWSRRMARRYRPDVSDRIDR